MAMNWQTFRVRSLSAIVFVAVMLTGLLWNEWSFLILFSVIHAGCWIEYQKLIQQIDIRAQQGGAFRVVGSILTGWGIMLYLSSEFSLALPISLEVAGIYIFQSAPSFFL
jgi:phosphatidate cytidylyltransferase